MNIYCPKCAAIVYSAKHSRWYPCICTRKKLDDEAIREKIKQDIVDTTMDKHKAKKKYLVGKLYEEKISVLEEENAKLQSVVSEQSKAYKELDDANVALEEELAELRRAIGSMVTRAAHCASDIQTIASAATWYPFKE